MKNDKHSFYIDTAKEVGIEKAIILKELSSIVEYKENNEIDICEGKGYAYYSSVALSKKFPYMNASSIRRWMIELERDGYIESKYLSSDKRDRVKWYHVKKTDSCIDQNEQSSIDQNEQCNNKDTPHSEYTTHFIPKEKNENGFSAIEKKVIDESKKFYQNEIEPNKSDPHIEGYRLFANYLFASNPFKKPIIHVLKIEKQLEFSEYSRLLSKSAYNHNYLIDILAQLSNNKKYTKDKESIFLTINSWIIRDAKNK